MHKNRRLLTRVLASVTLLALVACGPGTPTVSTSSTRSTVEVATGTASSPPLAVQLHRAVTTWNDARWYEWAAAVDQWNAAIAARSTSPPPARRRPRAHTDPDPGTVDLSGDRFDRLAACESSMNQDADDGQSPPHLSYFQWLLSTWHAAGGSGDPRDADYPTQKARAMEWAQVADPYHQWPHCWPASAA